MPTKKQTKQSKTMRINALKTKPKLNKKLLVLLTVVIAGIGAYFLFFASAASNNCQAQDGVQICDVDMVAGGSDTVLSTDGEAEILASRGWGMYFGANFRAPRSAYKGAVPITRVVNESVALHDWVTTAQKNAKEAKYGALRNEGVVFYAWEGPGVPGTVPVYRVGATNGGGTGAKNMYSVDKAWIDKILASDANNPEGWKADKFGPLIAFYAYPPGYAVANAPNPYDCSIQVNFLSDRCKMQREALLNAEKAGTLPAAPTASGYNPCPTTYQLYKSAPIGAKFDAACQKKWNTYAQDCSKQENFLSDNCKGPREALIAENNRIIELRRQEEARARQQSRSGGGGSGNDVIVPRGGGGVDCSNKEYFLTDACAAARERLQNMSNAINNINRATASQRERARVRQDTIDDAIRARQQRSFDNQVGVCMGSGGSRPTSRANCNGTFYIRSTSARSGTRGLCMESGGSRPTTRGNCKGTFYVRG